MKESHESTVKLKQSISNVRENLNAVQIKLNYIKQNVKRAIIAVK